MFVVFIFLLLLSEAQIDRHAPPPGERLTSNPGITIEELSQPLAYFCSGGGYVSNGECHSVVWALRKYFTQTSLAEMFSNTHWGSTSGGGWFVNDLLYSAGWQASMEEEDREKSLKLVAQFYNYLISGIYNIDYFGIEYGIQNGEFTRLSLDDWIHLLRTYSCKADAPDSCSSWRDIVTAFHFDYGSGVLPVQNLNWSTAISVALQYNQYKMKTWESAVDIIQRGSWNPCIPGAFHYTYDDAKYNNHALYKVDLPFVDDFGATVCTGIRLNIDCAAQNGTHVDHYNNCPAHSTCDGTFGFMQCVCNDGYVAKGTNQDVSTTPFAYYYQHADECVPCDTATSEMETKKIHRIKEVEVTWLNASLKIVDNEGDASAEVPIDQTPDGSKSLKDYVYKAVHNPRDYSGPSSSAGAMWFDEHRIGATILSDNEYGKFEASWTTDRLTDYFNASDATRLSLVDGASVDNCGLTALVRRLQDGIADEDIKDFSGTLVGMCSDADIRMLILNGNGEYDGRYFMFEWDGGKDNMVVEWKGEVLHVNLYTVTTRHEPYVGIRAGSKIKLVVFDFFGIYSNYGIAGKDDDNFDKGVKYAQPLLSLIPGRGETPEVVYALNYTSMEMEMFSLDLLNYYGVTTNQPDDVTTTRGTTDDVQTSTPTPTSNPSAVGSNVVNEDSDSSGSNANSTILILVGVLAGLMLLALGWFCGRKAQEKQDEPEALLNLHSQEADAVSLQQQA